MVITTGVCFFAAVGFIGTVLGAAYGLSRIVDYFSGVDNASFRAAQDIERLYQLVAEVEERTENLYDDVTGLFNDLAATNGRIDDIDAVFTDADGEDEDEDAE